ncbi:MAG: hypothetical protein OJJ55_06580 [Rhodococcus sp.]|nr:hypothetical protein [Rhodococcus sp. (in: high G+C Gram-positive bacteria)]
MIVAAWVVILVTNAVFLALNTGLMFADPNGWSAAGIAFGVVGTGVSFLGLRDAVK